MLFFKNAYKIWKTKFPNLWFPGNKNLSSTKCSLKWEQSWVCTYLSCTGHIITKLLLFYVMYITQLLLLDLFIVPCLFFLLFWRLKLKLYGAYGRRKHAWESYSLGMNKICLLDHWNLKISFLVIDELHNIFMKLINLISSRMIFLL